MYQRAPKRLVAVWWIAIALVLAPALASAQVGGLLKVATTGSRLSQIRQGTTALARALEAMGNTSATAPDALLTALRSDEALMANPDVRELFRAAQTGELNLESIAIVGKHPQLAAVLSKVPITSTDEVALALTQTGSPTGRLTEHKACGTADCCGICPLGRALNGAALLGGGGVTSIPTDLKPSEVVSYNMDKAFKVLDITGAERISYLIPDRIINGEVAWKYRGRDVVTYFTRTQHDHTLGIYKGGERDDASTIIIEGALPDGARPGSNWDTSEVQGFGSNMTWKSALLGENMGGGKGGVGETIDVATGEVIEELTPLEKRDRDRAIFYRLAPWIGPDKDVPAPDAFTGPANMESFANGYLSATKDPASAAYVGPDGDPNWFAVVTGKGLDFHGIAGRSEATGFGGKIATEVMLGGPVKGKTVSVPGYGNVGRNYAELMYADGAIIDGIGDKYGALITEKPEGLNIPEIGRWIDEHGSLQGYEANGVEWVPNTPEHFAGTERLLALDVDVLAPSAMGAYHDPVHGWTSTINERTAKEVKADFLVELENVGITPRGEAILLALGVDVAPDFWANAAGVSVSGQELRINTGVLAPRSSEEVLAEAEQKIRAAGAKIEQAMKDYNVDRRTAAYVVAIQRVRAARAEQGLPLKKGTEHVFIDRNGGVRVDWLPKNE